MLNKRVPVLNPDGTPAMPTKASRARRWIRDGFARVVKNDLPVFCVQLVKEPSGKNCQDISLGIDPGSCFTGVAVQSKQETLIGLNLNLPKKQVQKRLTERAVLRRTRRGRRIKRNLSFKLRNHRQKRFNNRRQSKLPPSIRANKQLELRVVDELRRLYPICHAYVERLNQSNSPGFTVAAQGQTFLIKELENRVSVTLVKGWETEATREWLKLPKSKNKGEQTPAAHVSDAIAQAARHFIRYAANTHHKEQTGYQWKGIVQVTPFTFGIVERLPSRPRKMHDLTVGAGGVRDTYGGFDGTHSFKNGDYVEYKTKRSTLKGYISANDLYQFFPVKKRLKQGVTDRNTRLISYSSHLVVNLHGGLAFLSR
ncbi:RRXRR domain-containing protein [Allocoleopsis franciscana]|uniref:RRXRR domain-containing protein n=1 Tax=Allocoleopsis franciscana PCC 7113 TaxID=1173027 RepID=K9WHD5_9CYAN|nr:RRXRR domain-containing protein [Allocoleopsis franciscana]AFZ18942.1 hypothetical protein Mic7113_3203 [Allocoleopsis franciscana PCC 7113]